MRTVGVVLKEGFLELCVDGADRIGEHIMSGIELLSEGSVGTFHTTIVLRPFRREDIKVNAQLCSCFFKMTHELRAPINLNGGDCKRSLLDQFKKEPLSGRACGL